MKLKDMDIVYVVKDAAFNEELRYSLRSVEKNFPCNKVFFYGGKPMYFKPDELILIRQRSGTKWDKVRSMLKLIAEDDRISDDFVLFNDDFFVMKPVENLPAYRYGTLEQLRKRIERNNGGRPTGYTRNIEHTIKALEEKDLPTWNFELHVPMVFNKYKLREIIEMFPDVRGTRSLYGNSFFTEKETKERNDVKIFRSKDMPLEDADYISTEDYTFKNGKVGAYIKERLNHKSRWEK